MSASEKDGCGQLELVHLYALPALPEDEVAAVEAHLAACAECREELEALRPAMDAFVSWPTNVLRPPASLWDRVSGRVAADTGGPPLPEPSRRSREPEWEEVAPGISCKLLSTDWESGLVSMLVRLAPKASYPPHRHAAVEELHLIDGVLIVNETTLHPGDYIRGEPGTSDALVYSEEGCTCVLITSLRDELR